MQFEYHVWGFPILLPKTTKSAVTKYQQMALK